MTQFKRIIQFRVTECGKKSILGHLLKSWARFLSIWINLRTTNWYGLFLQGRLSFGRPLKKLEQILFLESLVALIRSRFQLKPLVANFSGMWHSVAGDLIRSKFRFKLTLEFQRGADPSKLVSL